MKNEITLGWFLGIFTPIIVILIGWGMTISSKLEVEATTNKSQDTKIDQNREDNKSTDEKVDRLYLMFSDKLDKILYKLDEKADR